MPAILVLRRLRQENSRFEASLSNLVRSQYNNTGDFNTPLTPMDRSSRQKVSKEASDLKNTINQMNLIDTYRVFHPTAVEFTFFSAAHRTFSKIDHILGHKGAQADSKVCHSLCIWWFSILLMWALRAMNFHLNTAFKVSQRFWYVVSSFLSISRNFFISSLTSMTQSSFNSVVFSLHIFMWLLWFS